MNVSKQHLAAALARMMLCIWLICAFLLGTAVPALAAESQVVRVGYVQVENFEEGGPGEVKSGYGYEYLQMIRSYTGWTYEYVYGNWAQLLEMLEKGEIDLLSHVAMTAERKEKFLYALEPQSREPQYLFTREDNMEISDSNPRTLQGKVIGILAGITGGLCLRAGVRNAPFAAGLWNTKMPIRCTRIWPPVFWMP